MSNATTGAAAPDARTRVVEQLLALVTESRTGAAAAMGLRAALGEAYDEGRRAGRPIDAEPRLRVVRVFLDGLRDVARIDPGHLATVSLESIARVIRVVDAPH